MEDEELLVNDQLEDTFEVASESDSSYTRAVSVSWYDISVYAKVQSRSSWLCWGKGSRKIVEERQILSNVNGSVEPGCLLAVMGGSGSGKTTLLNVLTGRSLSNLRVQGVVMVNGKPVQGSVITRMSAYVQQEDVFIGTLTVKEHLIFQAQLRLDQNLTLEEKMKRVDAVLQELGLSKCSETLIGIPGRVKGISGGEMKRLAFASEVLMEPSLLFCDEPTSGLDSFMAYSVVSVLKELSAGGKTVVCTIHQPSSEIFALFDRLLLMAEGRVAFMGDSRDALEMFARQGLRCPLNFNPGDYYISQLYVVQGKEMECRLRIKKICDYYAKTYQEPEFSSSVTKEIESGNVLIQDNENEKFAYKTTWCHQMRLLLWRCSLVARREKLLSLFRIFQTLAIALIVCLVYGGQRLDQFGVANINGAIFFLIINLSMQNATNVIRVFCDEFPVFLREHWSGLYRTDTYFLSKTLSELPVFSFLPVLMVVVVYWWIGLNQDVMAFFFAIFVCVLVGNAACSFGYMLSGLCKTAKIASLVMVPTIVPLMLFGGFFLKNRAVPVYLDWFKYFSWFYYANEALCINQWKDINRIGCNNVSKPCLSNGDLVLKSLNFNKNHFYPNIGYLILLIFGFRLIAYAGIVVKSRRRI